MCSGQRIRLIWELCSVTPGLDMYVRVRLSIHIVCGSVSHAGNWIWVTYTQLLLFRRFLCRMSSCVEEKSKSFFQWIGCSYCCL